MVANVDKDEKSAHKILKSLVESIEWEHGQTERFPDGKYFRVETLAPIVEFDGDELGELIMNVRLNNMSVGLNELVRFASIVNSVELPNFKLAKFDTLLMMNNGVPGDDRDMLISFCWFHKSY